MPKTRDGIEVEPGQVWRDMDKRMKGRQLYVQSVDDRYAYCCANGKVGEPIRNTRLMINRMHNHSTGYALVSWPNGAKE